MHPHAAAVAVPVLCQLLTCCITCKAAVTASMSYVGPLVALVWFCGRSCMVCLVCISLVHQETSQLLHASHFHSCDNQHIWNVLRQVTQYA
jgi:hypothetical protein